MEFSSTNCCNQKLQSLDSLSRPNYKFYEEDYYRIKYGSNGFGSILLLTHYLTCPKAQ
jgi:hypothetical protein